MTDRQRQIEKKTLLVFNCHEAWVYQLGYLGFNLDIIVGLKGRYKAGWDEQMRPLPKNSRVIELDEALKSKAEYYCIITHNITDLLDVKTRNEPKLIVLHSTLEGRVQEEKSRIAPEQLSQMLHKYLDAIGGHAVATSLNKGQSWGFSDDIISFGMDTKDYYPHTGELSCGLRICNFIENRRKILIWDFHEKAFEGLPVKIVGHNPNMPAIKAAENWDELKRLLQSHRFYIHTADPRYEEGYNMSVCEAMAAGLPVLGNTHPTSPIKHGVNGFLSDNPDELRKYAMMLLEDKDLAIKMGQEAGKTAIEQFSIKSFREAFLKSIETSRLKSRVARPVCSD